MAGDFFLDAAGFLAIDFFTAGFFAAGFLAAAGFFATCARTPGVAQRGRAWEQPERRGPDAEVGSLEARRQAELVQADDLVPIEALVLVHVEGRIVGGPGRPEEVLREWGGTSEATFCARGGDQEGG